MLGCEKAAEDSFWPRPTQQDSPGRAYRVGFGGVRCLNPRKNKAKMHRQRHPLSSAPASKTLLF